MVQNTLYYGDNLDVLRRYIKDESIDLIYLDPPFNSNADYNVLFAEQDGSRAAAQIKAFGDAWRWDMASARAYAEMIEAGPSRVARAMMAFHTLLGESDVLAYLAMMAPRLVEIQRVMKPTASIYLHCDPTASHYLKLLMDAVFGVEKFQNEIVWSYKRYTASSNRFQRLHDVILFYKNGETSLFNDIREEYGSKSGKADSHYKQDEDGRWYRWQKRRGQEPYKIYLSEGRRPGDVWEIPVINASAKERLGYPTQKPEALLDRIIKASSNENHVVLDPFCGCGTSIAVAQRLGRRWIGIDITHLAISLIKARLHDAYDGAIDKDYNVIGEPVSLPDAEVLARQDRYQFQYWALGLVGARPVASEQKKGADKGIDGRLYFHDDVDSGKTKQIILSVKSGKTDVTHVRDLRGVSDREKAAIGVLLTVQEPTGPMRTEAASAGFYASPWGTKHPKLQILTIAELLSGKKIDMPPSQDQRTFKKAPKARKGEGERADYLALPFANILGERVEPEEFDTDSLPS
jgi:DNA modification methylase